MPQPLADVVQLRPRTCHKSKCKRLAKTWHECAVCGELRGACGFHNEQVYAGLSSHITAEHPKAREAERKAVEQGPLSPQEAEQIIERRGRWAVVATAAVMIAIVVLIILLALRF